MSVKACRFLSDVSLRCDESGTHHRHALGPAAVYPGSTRQPHSHLSTSLSQARTWGGGRGIAAPHPSIKHFNMWLGTKPGLSTPWKSGILKSAGELVQFGTAPGIPPELCPCPLTCWEPLWASASLKSAVCLTEIKAGYPSWHKISIFWGNYV